MKQLSAFLILIILIGCSGTQAASEMVDLAPELEPFVTVVSTVAPTDIVPATLAPTPVPTTLTEGYPAPESYPEPSEPASDSAYPVPTPIPTESPAEQAIGSGLHYLDETGLWRVTADGLTAQIVPLTGASKPHFSFDSTKIAYMLDGEPAIILLDIFSGEITSLSSGSDDFICCIFDWVGESILTGVQGTDDFGPNIGRLVAITPDNTVTPISNDLIGGLPSFHPTGLRVAYSENGQMQIYDYGQGTTTIEATSVTDLSGVPLTVQNLSYSTASWSPMLQHIAWAVSFVQEGEVKLGYAILDLEDDSVKIFHPYTAVGREYIPPAATWHSLRPLIVFETIDQDESQRGVWLVDYATGEEQFILAGRNPIFSPDGDYLAIEHEAGIQIYALADGSLALLPAGQIVDWR